MPESLHVTGCRVFLNQTEDDRLKGFASIILNNEFAVCDLKIIRGNKGLFVAMPSRRRRDGTFHDVAHPIVPTLREHIETIVLNEYHQQVQAQTTGADSFGKSMATSRHGSEFLDQLDSGYGMDDEYSSRR